MSELSVTACDGCGRAAPPQHTRTFPSAGWWHLSGDLDTPLGGLDACSPECLATIAASVAAGGHRPHARLGRRAVAASAVDVTPASDTRKAIPAARAKPKKRAGVKQGPSENSSEGAPPGRTGFATKQQAERLQR